MEITLEKIELVKDRTGVSYAKAKAALERAGGSVVDAIIMIEEEIDIVPKTKAGDQASQIVEKIKALVKKGNISKILVKKDGSIVVNLPVNVGLLGIVFVPWVTLVSVIAALGTKCSIELVKDNGEVVNLSSKAAETFDDVKSNYSVIADDLKEKSEDAFSQVKEKASSVISKVKREEDTYEDDDYFNFDDFDDSVFDDFDETDGVMCETSDAGIMDKKAKAAEKVGAFAEMAAEKAEAVADKAKDLKDVVENKAEKIADAMEDKAEAAAHRAEDAADLIMDRVEDTAEDLKDKMEDAADSVKDKFDEAGEKFEETIEDYKAKRNRFKFFE